MAENDREFRFPTVDLPAAATTSPEAAMRHLVEHLVASGQLQREHADSVVEHVLRRESQGSTGIGRGIAVPHAKSECVDRVVGVEGRSEGPVNWPGAADSEPVHHVCLLVTPTSQPSESLRALKEVVQRLQAVDPVLATIPLKDGREAAISHVVPGDAPALLAFVEKIAVETDYLTFGAGEFDLNLEQEVAFIQSLADRAKGLMLKATVGDLIVGTAIVIRSPRPRLRHAGELGLSVTKEFWGGGIGRALCRTLFAEARTVGIDRIHLKVRADNAKAIRLYESLGFVHEGRLKDGMRIAGVSWDELIMSLGP